MGGEQSTEESATLSNKTSPQGRQSPTKPTVDARTEQTREAVLEGPSLDLPDFEHSGIEDSVASEHSSPPSPSDSGSDDLEDDDEEPWQRGVAGEAVLCCAVL